MRAFAGTLLSDYTQEYYRAAIGDLVSGHGETLRSIPDASAHLTYVFLGNITDEQQSMVRSAIHGVAARHHSIRIQLGPPRILWAGRTPRLICSDIAEGAEPLRRIGDSLLASLRDATGRRDLSGMKSAHVTLARFRKQAVRADARAVEAALLDPRYTTGLPADRIASIQLIASRLTPDGSIYQVIESHPLPVGG